MRQLFESLLWLALLAVAPGCALFGGNSSKRIHERDVIQPTEEAKDDVVQPMVEEAPDEDAKRPTAKLMERPPVGIEPLPEVEPDKKPGAPGMLTIDPVKRIVTPPTGNVTVPGMLDAMGIKNTSAQGAEPGPLVDRKSDLAPLARAIDLSLSGKNQEAIQALSAYDAETQEFFLRILPLLTVLAKNSINNFSSQELANVHDLLTGLREHLRTRCELLVNRMAFCQEIYGFANYKSLPDNYAFLKATENQAGERVQLYVELKNFASVKGKDGAYLTKLACKLELKDSNNKEVWRCSFDPKETTYRRSACMNDYHGNFSFYVPPIPAGTYKLTLQVVDETLPNVRRVARHSLDFRVTPVANQTTLR